MFLIYSAGLNLRSDKPGSAKESFLGDLSSHFTIDSKLLKLDSLEGENHCNIYSI